MVRAEAVDYKAGKIEITLSDGQTLHFAPGDLQGLGNATPEQLADVEIYPGGTVLHWRNLNECFEVDGLVKGVTGSRQWMATRAKVAQ